ncbi:GAST1 protein homolog 5 [Arabidopsis thaliana]|uniref:GAST1 protein homolog 5 n=1 Tax=Arabidopsis thaliana TaxID=3702 RepID=A0A1I9LQD0_ARATH|nr:GAST1 protein homolog 5 [Arabidopsis thaliana]ANM64788.1 GAST1 protein homolog 5 [Arabidopsis thaliana]|eukprot:NP_001326793.1 GAST1 protein homolog 5 [Arabidopsis thaliana]
MANCIRRNALFFLTLLFLLSVSNLVQSATQSVASVVQQHHTRSHACSFASSVAKNVFVFLLALSATNKLVHVTTTGRLKKAVQNVLKTSF